MEADPSFNSTENQALLVVCARKTIRTAAIVGIVWGVINLFIGYTGLQVNLLNAGLVALALLMLGTGIVALARPSLGALLSEAIVSTLLFFWNLGVTILNSLADGAVHVSPYLLILPMVAAIAFFQRYVKLGHLKGAIGTMNHETIKEATRLCKQLFKSKVKESPDIAEATSRRCRLKLMADSVFCAQRNLTHAFHMNRSHFQQCITDANKKKIRVVVRHPLGKLTYAFDKKNSEKIKGWLGLSAAQTS
jgi:hypothetical protein